MTTKAMLLVGDMWEKNPSRASSPPAEAPIPTIGNISASSSVSFSLPVCFTLAGFFRGGDAFFVPGPVFLFAAIADSFGTKFDIYVVRIVYPIYR